MTDTEEIDLNQVAVESRVYDLESVLTDLARMRLDEQTSALVAAEGAGLSRCLTCLQMLMSHIAASENRPRLRVVR